LIDSYPEFSASVIALNNFFSSILSGIISILILPMINTMGLGWSFSLLGFSNIFSIVFLVLIYQQGKKRKKNPQVS